MNNEKDYEVMLTTYDNRFNPFENFEAWWKEDLRLGHDCCGILAKVAVLNDVASEGVNNDEILRAIDEIVAGEPTIFKKISKNNVKVA